MAFDFLAGKRHLTCFLVTIQTPDGVYHRIIDEKSFTVGRSTDSALSFPEPNISRVHIVVSCKKDQIWLIDQGSANGTFINGQKVLPNKMTVVQSSDDVKLGTSEIHLKFEVYEKTFKPDAIVNSLLPDNEKTSLMEVVQGAHQQAKRILLQAQEHYDKLIKTAEGKVRNVENSLLVKQDEIIQAANTQANQIIQEGKKRSAQVIFEAEEKAIEATKEVFAKAEETKIKADDYFQGKVSEAQEKADTLIRNHVEMGQQMLHQASEKAQAIKKQLEQESDNYKQLAYAEGEKIKKDFLDQARVEMTTHLAELKREVDSAQTELNQLRSRKEKEFGVEIEKRRLEMESSLGNIKRDLEKASLQHAEALKKQESELESVQRRRQNELDKMNDERLIHQRNQENELQLFLRRKELELDKLNEEKENQLKKRTEEISFVVEQQEAVLRKLRETHDRETKSYQQNLEQQFQKHLHDVERMTVDKEREMRQKVEFELTDKRRAIHNSEAEVLALKNEAEIVQKKIEAIQNDARNEEQKLVVLRGEIQKTQSEKRAVEDSYDGVLKQIKHFDQEKKNFQDRVKELEVRAGHLQLAIEESNRKLSDLGRDFELKTLENKTKLESQFAELKREKEKQFQDSFNAETEKAKQMKFHLLQEIQSKQSQIERDIQQKIMKVMAGIVPQENIAMVDSMTAQQIKAGFEENVASILAQSQAGQINTSDLAKKQQTMKVKFASSGFAVGLVLMGGFHVISEQMRTRSISRVLATESAERDKARVAAGFNPPQDRVVREEYVDSVIYTLDFSKLYANSDIQDRWVREAKDYFYKTWRVDEQETIKVLSMAKTLVKTLEDKRQKIHPDFVKENILKMRELEAETVAKIKDVLGTEVKFSAFKKFEMKFFKEELEKRAPAEVYVDPNLEDTK